MPLTYETMSSEARALVDRKGAPPPKPASDFRDCANPVCRNRIVKPNLLCSRCRQKLPYALKRKLGSSIYDATAHGYDSEARKAAFVDVMNDALAQCLEYLRENNNATN